MSFMAPAPVPYADRDPRPTRDRLRRLAIVALVLAGPLARAGDVPAPVPDATARSAATAALRKEFARELSGKDAKGRRELAQKLLERAASTDVDAAVRYAAFEMSVAIDVEQRDLRAALDAGERFAAAFDVSAATLGLVSVTIICAGTKEPSVIAEGAGAAIELAGRALDTGDDATAARALSTSVTLAKSVKLGGLAARATALSEFPGTFRTLSGLAAVGRKTLEASPDDAGAHEAVGRFLCFGRGRWSEGVAHLAKSSNAATSEPAAREARHESDPAARDAVADAWWDLGQKEKVSLVRARLLGHAASLYEAALVDASAERRAFVRARLDTITFRAFDGGVALTKDFTKDGPVSHALAAVRAYIAKQGIDRRSSDWKTKLPRFPDLSFARGEEYLWHLETTQGAITIRFFPDTAPKHVANFIYLSELGFFDGLSFHRVVPGFMAQGGCPRGTGGGDPGYLFEGEYGPGHKQDKPGMLAMANTGQPSSDGSQFFITFRATPELDGKHTCFGEVVDGMDVLRKLEAQGTPDPGRPKIPLGIQSARVTIR